MLLSQNLILYFISHFYNLLTFILIAFMIKNFIITKNFNFFFINGKLFFAMRFYLYPQDSNFHFTISEYFQTQI